MKTIMRALSTSVVILVLSLTTNTSIHAQKALKIVSLTSTEFDFII